jgi:hypothetical protein
MGATGGEYGLAINHTSCIIGIVADSISCILQSLTCAHSLQREWHNRYNDIRTYEFSEQFLRSLEFASMDGTEPAKSHRW